VWARIHRWLAIVLVVMLVAWSVTGLLFHIKPGWQRAYDMLSGEQRDAPLPSDVIPFATLQQAAPGAQLLRVELFQTVLGPLYRVRTAKSTRLVDARSGAARSPLDASSAQALAVDAVSRSAQRASYGQPSGAEISEHSVRVRFSGGPSVEVGRDDARLSQRGADTDRIDWLYRIHYLQWTGNPTFDRLLPLAGLALIWAVMIPGIVLFVQRLRRRRSTS
jgi:uncharacterized iron-regulated membrane protein